MRLEKKVSVGRLDIIRTADATNFIGKFALIFHRAEVFDNGVAKDNFERLIGERQLARIPQNPIESATLRPLNTEIQNRHARHE